VLRTPQAGRARSTIGALLTTIVLVTFAGACTDGEDDSAGDPDLFCDSAREAFTGSTEFDFGDPAQRQQVLDVLDRMVEYAPGDIKDEAEDTRDAVGEYAEKVAELAERQDEIDSTDDEAISPEAVAEIQDLVAELEDSQELADAQDAITPYLQDTCAIDLGITGATTTLAPPAGETTTTTAAP
jgi:hypothetical protein